MMVGFECIPFSLMTIQALPRRGLHHSAFCQQSTPIGGRVRPFDEQRARPLGENPLCQPNLAGNHCRLTPIHPRRIPMTAPKTPRRRSLLKGAAVAAGAMSAPMVMAQTPATAFRFQSTWPAKDIFHEYALDFAKKVNDMAGGRLKIEVLPAGAVVPAFQLLEAVNKGTLDGGHGVVAYHYGKNSALALWGSGPAYGMDPNMVLAWHNYGGGKALLDEIYKAINMDVVSYLYGPMPTQPLGWFKKPVSNVAQLKGLKFRTVGLAVDVFKELGVAVNPLPGGEIVPALDRGLIDAAEFNNASSDRVLGFPDVAKNCMLQSFHQSGEQFEILFNKPKYNALPQELRSIIDYAVQASSADMSWKAIDRNSKDYIELKTKDKVNFYKTPDSILRAQLDAWDKVIAAKAKENPHFQKVLDSQKEFAQRAGQWQNDYSVDFKMAYNRYFGTQPKKS
jgi:TRAP-type mannitol/chloroaromatic compound transport system substrate-binding protein